MAISLIATIKRFQGLSTDDKPIIDIPEGSTFHEIDTGMEFILHQGMWEQDLRRVSLNLETFNTI